MTLNQVEQFRDTIRAAGLTPPEVIEPGRFHRFPGIGKNNGNKAGWCKLFPDGIGGTFGDHAAGVHESWQASREKPMTAAERAAFAEQVKQAREEADAKRREIHTAAAERAARIYADLKPDPVDHPYLASKGMRPHCARIDLDGRLVVPVYSGDGTDRLQSLQFIAHDGEKRFLPDGKMAGGWCAIGTPKDGEPLLLAEGFATGASLHEATGRAAVVAFTAGNLLAVAKMIRTRWPGSALLICGDDDARTEGNPGRSKAEAAAIATDARVVFPSFSGSASGTDFNDVAAVAGLDEVRRQIEIAAPTNGQSSPVEISKPAARLFHLLTPAELKACQPVGWRVKHVVPRVGIGALYGPSTGGKSFIGIDLLGACARAVDWHGYRTYACPVTYIAAEGEAGVAQRVKAYEKVHGELPDTFRAVTTSLDILNATDRIALVDAIRAAGQMDGIVVFDTLNRSAPGIDENDSADMGNVVTALKWMQAELGGLVLVVHHTGKDASRGPRGHSSLFAALDFGLEITRDGNRRQWINRKTRDGEDGKKHPFTLKVVEVGFDEDGDPITSCVIEQEIDAGHAVRSIKLPSGGNQRIVWDALGELLRQPAALVASGAPADLPAGRPAIRLEDAITKLRGRLPEVEQKRQRERITDAVTGLINRGALVLRDGWIWCA
jgi:phage/plasmid primase-like uncharacterized protein